MVAEDDGDDDNEDNDDDDNDDDDDYQDYDVVSDDVNCGFPEVLFFLCIRLWSCPGALRATNLSFVLFFVADYFGCNYLCYQHFRCHFIVIHLFLNARYSVVLMSRLFDFTLFCCNAM